MFESKPPELIAAGPGFIGPATDARERGRFGRGCTQSLNLATQECILSANQHQTEGENPENCRYRDELEFGCSHI
jgi:hypothetical protein